MRTFSGLTGFPAAVLRAWERRYDFLKPMRGSGGHRLYTEADRRVLDSVRELMEQGRSIGEVALLGRDVLLDQAGDRSNPGSGPEVFRWREQFLQGALMLDRNAMCQALEKAFLSCTPDTVVDEFMIPVVIEIGTLWERGECSVASEHMASALITQRIQKLVHSFSQATNGPKVIVACFPEEQHELGILVLTYRLSCQGYQVCYLGSSLPFVDLRIALEQLRPMSCYLSATRPKVFQSCRNDLLKLVGEWGGEVKFFIGGRGVGGDLEDLMQLGVNTDGVCKTG
ncbi:MAG: MerR family transcriptional regulator [Planctomycetota bacterium]|jgi:methanogenic corrinoid protein MtbC1|nr:MerR family transcriptional regulator [Planctomycetota bacterium]